MKLITKFAASCATIATVACIALATVALGAQGAASAATAAASSAATPSYYRLVQYPKAGFGGLYSQIASAKHSIDMEMYELSDPTAEQDLGQAAASAGSRYECCSIAPTRAARSTPLLTHT